jgi:hypothetical protein
MDSRGSLRPPTKSQASAGTRNDRIDGNITEGFVTNFLEKLALVEQDIAETYGEFSLFLLLLREDSIEKWDVVAAAPWLSADRRADIEMVWSYILKRLDQSDIMQISRVVILEVGGPLLSSFLHEIAGRKRMIEIPAITFAGVRISRGYVISAKEKVKSKLKKPMGHAKTLRRRSVL